MQAYGWSLPSKYSSEGMDGSKDLISVPVPVYCRPLNLNDPGMKVSKHRVSLNHVNSTSPPTHLLWTTGHSSLVTVFRTGSTYTFNPIFKFSVSDMVCCWCWPFRWEDQRWRLSYRGKCFLCWQLPQWWREQSDGGDAINSLDWKQHSLIKQSDNNWCKLSPKCVGLLCGVHVPFAVHCGRPWSMCGWLW